jgi:RNA polymerase sigma factor for flagellar operon FliA
VRHYAHYAAYLAERHWPGVERDFLIAAGLVGIWQSITAFRPDNGNRFLTFATPRMLGEMQDAMRKEDRLSRVQRSRRKLRVRAERAFEERTGFAATNDELAAELGLDRADFEKFYRGTELDDPLSLSYCTTGEREKSRPLSESVEDTTSGSPQGSALRADFWSNITRCLTARNRRVMIAFYRDGMSCEKIAEHEGITQSRIWQILMASRTLIRRSVSVEDLCVSG